MAAETLLPAARRRALRPRRRRHAAEPQRPRLPRGARRARPLPRPPAVPAADAAGARAACGVVNAGHPADAAGHRPGSSAPTCSPTPSPSSRPSPGWRAGSASGPRTVIALLAVRRHAVRARGVAAPRHRRPRRCGSPSSCAEHGIDRVAGGRQPGPSRRSATARPPRRSGAQPAAAERGPTSRALWRNLAELRRAGRGRARRAGPARRRCSTTAPLVEVPLLAGDVHDLAGARPPSGRHLFAGP